MKNYCTVMKTCSHWHCSAILSPAAFESGLMNLSFLYSVYALSPACSLWPQVNAQINEMFSPFSYCKTLKMRFKRCLEKPDYQDERLLFKGVLPKGVLPKAGKFHFWFSCPFIVPPGIQVVTELANCTRSWSAE